MKKYPFRIHTIYMKICQKLKILCHLLASKSSRTYHNSSKTFLTCSGTFNWLGSDLVCARSDSFWCVLKVKKSYHFLGALWLWLRATLVGRRTNSIKAPKKWYDFSISKRTKTSPFEHKPSYFQVNLIFLNIRVIQSKRPPLRPKFAKTKGGLFDLFQLKFQVVWKFYIFFWKF